MRKSRIIIAPEVDRDKPAVSLVFDKDCCLIRKVIAVDDAAPLDHVMELSGDSSSKTTEIHPLGIHYYFWKSIKKTVFSNGMNTHVSNRSLANIKIPLCTFFDDNKHDNCNLRSNT